MKKSLVLVRPSIFWAVCKLFSDDVKSWTYPFLVWFLIALHPTRAPGFHLSKFPRVLRAVIKEMQAAPSNKWNFVNMLISVAGLSLSRPQSLAISFWVIFELIIKESGDDRNDGKGRTSEPLPSLLFLPITYRSRSTIAPIVPLSRFSLVSSSRVFSNPYLALGKPVEESGTGPYNTAATPLISASGQHYFLANHMRAFPLY